MVFDLFLIDAKQIGSYFFSTHNSQLISPRRIANTAADKNPEIRNQSTRLAVKNTIPIVIINDTRPSVRKLSGSVRTRKIVPIKALTKPKTTATIMAVHKLSTVTPGVRYEARATAIPDTTKLIINLIMHKSDKGINMIRL